MRIEVMRLPEGRELQFFEEWDAQGRELDIPGWQYQGPLKVEARATRDIGVIKVKFSVSAAVDLTCGRCLKRFPHPFQRSFDLVYPVDLAGKTIFLDDDARQELILNYPQKILCSEDCKGLCGKCGSDLNEVQCKCTQ